MAKPLSEGKKTVGRQAVENDFFALIIYILLSAWLFLPYLNRLTSNAYGLAYAINPIVAAWGVFFLGRRWINSWTPSVLTGIVYGFGPFALSFLKYHPLAGIIYAMIPWLFLPSVYWHRSSAPTAGRFLTRALFSLLPFAAVILIFQLLNWAGPYFLVPQSSIKVSDFQALIFPLYKINGHTVFSIYHFPMLLALMGIFVLAAVQRIALLIPFATGLILCFVDPVMEVSPIAWAAFPVLFLSLISGLGFQSMLYAGRTDAKWIIACAAIAAVLTAFFAGLSLHPMTGEVFNRTALLYAASAAALSAVYYLTRIQQHPAWGKLVILSGIALLDIILSAPYIIQQLL